MTQNLTKFLSNSENKKYATHNGTYVHALLKNVIVDDATGNHGDVDMIEKISNTPGLSQYFCATSRTEVPIAGFVNGIFLSRRIDRLLVDNETQTVYFIDYKSDIDKTQFIEKYKKQIDEYAILLRSVYPNYAIVGYILWLNDWTLERVQDTKGD